MTKADIVKEIARVTEIPQKEAKIVLEIVLDGMVHALSNGERIELRGFGSFSTHVRARRKARNPRTGGRVYVPARRVPSFRPSVELKALVNSPVDCERPSAILAETGTSPVLLPDDRDDHITRPSGTAPALPIAVKS